MLSALALTTALLAPGSDVLQLTNVPLPGVGPVTLELHRTTTLTDDFRVEVRGAGVHGRDAGAATGADATAATAPTAATAAMRAAAAARSVATFAGPVAGFPNGHAIISLSPWGASGLVELEGRRFTLVPQAAAGAGGAGLVRGPARWVESPGAGAPDAPEPCRALRNPDPSRGANDGGVAGTGSGSGMRDLRVRIAADCDQEFTAMFAGEAEAAAYVTALYAAIDDVYRRECGVRIQLSYVRLWTTEADPYQDPDPLGQFRDVWEAEQGSVVRDVAQLLTGRRNLPYGGVAWLNAACGSFGYSVCGYLIGQFADPGRTDPGNWDVIVTAHELGHNIGTLHTHDYGIDTCASGTVLRGTIMSYCHTVSGATANVDMGFHVICRQAMESFMVTAPCLGHDCDGDGVEDLEAITAGLVADSNADGIPDSCQDCDGDGVLDPEEISAGAADLDANGIPDACQPDCNGNGVPDSIDIAAGTSQDLWGNGIPDECERDCDGNGTSDYTQILADMSLDRDRNGLLDSCQDCDSDGILDAAALGGARHWWLASAADGRIRELHGRSGVKLRETPALGAPAWDVVLRPGHERQAVVSWGNRVTILDLETATFPADLVTEALGGLSDARGLLWMPDGTLLVASNGNRAILRYGDDGAFLGTFAASAALGTTRPVGLALRSDGAVAVSCSDGRVRGFNSAGASIGVLADLKPLNSSPDLTGVLYLPSGDLLVASRTLDTVERFDGVTGAYKGRFDVGPNAGSSIATKDPVGLALVNGGAAVLVTNTASGAPIVGYDPGTGYHLRTYRVYPLDAPQPRGILVVPPSPFDCNHNWLPDSCDIAQGVSQDVNGDGVPDECQSAAELADLNGDGHVDGADLGLLLAAWGSSGPGDVNGDGVVDGADLGQLLAAWTG